MTFKKLREAKFDVSDPNLPPEIHRVGIDKPTPDPRFRGKTTFVGDNIKRVGNTRNDMALLDMYVHGPLKPTGWDKVCGSCIYYYSDPNLKPHHGRCRAYGYKQVHEQLAADDKDNYMEPDGQVYFPHWIGCPTWSPSDRLSRK